MSSDMQLDRAQADLAGLAYAKTFELLISLMGAPWVADDEPPSLDEEEVRRNRVRYAMPVGQGALLALIEYIWVTAPVGGTKDELARMMGANVNLLLDRATAMRTAGHFWTDTASLAGRREP